MSLVIRNLVIVLAILGAIVVLWMVAVRQDYYGPQPAQVPTAVSCDVRCEPDADGQ